MIIEAKVKVYKIHAGYKVTIFDPKSGIMGWAVQPTLEAARAMAEITFKQEFNGLVEEYIADIEVNDADADKDNSEQF